MDESRKQLLVTTSVFVGALILFGPLTYGILYVAADALAQLVGLDGGLTGIAASVVMVLAVLAAGEVVAEITAIQLYGFDALWRGSRRQRMGRHLLLSVVVLAAAGLLVGYLADVTMGAAGDTRTLALAGLVALAFAWAGGRTVMAFRQGYSGSE